MKRLISALMVIVIVATLFCGCTNNKASVGNAVDTATLIQRENEIGSKNSYEVYLLSHSNAQTNAKDVITLPLDAAQKNGKSFVWNVSAVAEGLYYIQVHYLPHPVNDEDGTSVSFKLNGKVPYYELNSAVLPDEYVDVFPLIQDKFGNDLRPNQKPAEKETLNYLFDSALTYTEPLGVYLEKGSSTLQMDILSGTADIKSVYLKPADNVKSYEQVKNEYAQKGYSEIKGDLKLYQGEESAFKSSTMLYPVSLPSLSPMVLVLPYISTISVPTPLLRKMQSPLRKMVVL